MTKVSFYGTEKEVGEQLWQLRERERAGEIEISFLSEPNRDRPPSNNVRVNGKIEKKEGI